MWTRAFYTRTEAEIKRNHNILFITQMGLLKLGWIDTNLYTASLDTYSHIKEKHWSEGRRIEGSRYTF